jgi:hypothetical protein
MKPDEAAVVSWRCQYPRPPGITIHTGADAQGARPEAKQLATDSELGLSASSLARRLDARLGGATVTRAVTESAAVRAQHRYSFMMAVSQLRSGSAVASGTGAVLVPAAGILRSLPARLGSWPAA